MKQTDFYIQLLEHIVDDQSQEIDQMAKELLVLSHTIIERKIPFDQIPNINKCSLCGLELSGVMSYNCPNLKCPTGLGPVYCKT